MDFLKRKMSRIGLTLCHYKVMIKPKTLELVTEKKGVTWVTLKRGRHKDKTDPIEVNANE